MVLVETGGVLALLPSSCLSQQTGPTSGFGVEMVKRNDLRTDHRTKMAKKKDVL